MQFLNPAWLLALWTLPFAFAFLIAMRRRRSRRVSRLGSTAAKSAAGGDKTFYAQAVLTFAALALVFISLARPWWGERDEESFVSTRNVLVLLDVSRSMLAQDIRPSRLGRAKADLSDLARDLDGDRACLVAFRSDAQILCPFTTDTGFFLEALEGAGIDSAARGETDLGRALGAALEAFKGREADHNAILLVSDGEDLGGRAISEAKKCAEAHIPVFCIGMGGSTGATIPVGDGGETMKHDGKEVVTTLDASTLKTVAETSGGVYLPLASTSSGARTLGSIYKKHVRALVESDIRAETERRRIERYGIFLLPALLLLLAAAAISPGRPLGRVRHGASIVVLMVALPVAQATAAPNPRDMAREAKRLAEEGKTEQALALYDEALASPDVPGSALENDIRLNAAITALDSGDAQDAASRFKALPESFESSAGFGIAMAQIANETGNDDANPTNRVKEVGRRLSAMQEAADAFAAAVRLRPEDAVARTNLLVAASAVRTLRKELETARFEEKFGGKQPGEILSELLALQRDAYAAASVAVSNNSPAAIKLRERAAGRQREAAEVWQPLRKSLSEIARTSMTNENEVAAFEARLDEAADAASGAADALDSFLPDFLPAMRSAEQTAFALQPIFADPLTLLSLAIDAQSNALRRVADPVLLRTPVEEQEASAWLFNAFSEKISQFLDGLEAEAENKAVADAPATRGDMETSDNAEKLATEVRAEIRRLCSETAGTYSLLAMALDPSMKTLPDDQLPNARQIAANLEALRKLLSPPPQQQQQQQQQQQPQQQNQQSSSSDKSEDGDKSDNSDNAQDADKANKPENSNESGDPDETEDSGSLANTDDRDDNAGSDDSDAAEDAADADASEASDASEAEALMQKVLEQEKRRAEEKRARRRALPPKVGERDW